jgi:hypothetical protein
MTADLIALEAKVGQELPAGRFYAEGRAMVPWSTDVPTKYADDALAEAYALIERLVGESDEEQRLRKNAGAAAVLAIELKDKAEADKSDCQDAAHRANEAAALANADNERLRAELKKTEQALFAANCMLRDLGVHPATLERA